MSASALCNACATADLAGYSIEASEHRDDLALLVGDQGDWTDLWKDEDGKAAR